MAIGKRRLATIEDLLAIPEAARFHELIGGELIEKATPSAEHGDAQSGVASALKPAFQRPPGHGGPGGWWILTEVEVWLESGDVVRPDVVGWRRERSPERPTGAPVRMRPDWTCEVVSPSRPNDDTVKKLRLYHRAALPHYWIVDLRDQTFTALRWAEAGWVTLVRSERTEVVRAEPFEAVEINVGVLFGADPP